MKMAELKTNVLSYGDRVDPRRMPRFSET